LLWFFGYFKVESRVTSEAWADASRTKLFLFYCSKLVFQIGNVGILMLKVVLGHLSGCQRAPKSAKKASDINGING
jgi:hypothetical protein